MTVPINDRWTPENEGKLRDLWPTKLTAREIAAEIGPWCTKQAVIGKADRMGLDPRGQKKPAPPTICPPEKPKFKPVEVGAPVVPETTERREAFVAPAVLKPIQVEDFIEIPPTARVALVDLEPHHCRWPIGDPSSPHFGFCGEPRAEPGNPYHAYCEKHGARAYTTSRNAGEITEEHKAKIKAGRLRAHARKAI